MERSYFRDVKEAFSADHESSLRTLGVELQKGGNAQWKQVKCPCCTDTDGSASIARATGFLRCHQCGRKIDLFEWYAELHGGNAWEAAKTIGGLLGVPFAMPQKKGREVQQMTPARLDRAIINLLEHPEAEPARRYLEGCKLLNYTGLSRFGVGWLDGVLVFAQFFPNGELRKRFRRHAWLARQKWGWSRGPGGPVGFWPWMELPDNAIILICEGEKDVMTAYFRLRLHLRDVPVYAFTWTGGAGSPVSSSLMPDSWAGREVYICYDNDTFQGPAFKDHRAPETRKMKDMLRRRENLIHGVAAKFEANKCKVHLMAVPIDPIDRWGADLRDWVDDGKNYDDLPHWDLSDLLEAQDPPREVPHSDVFSLHDGFIVTQGSVATIEHDSLYVPSASRIVCPQGQYSYCGECGVTRLFGDGIIDWNLHREDLVRALMSKDPDKTIINDLCRKPKRCNDARIDHIDHTNGSWWMASSGSTDEGDGTEHFPVISTERPSLSGDVGITGHIVRAGKSSAIFATHLEQLDKPEVDLELVHQELLSLCPWGSNNVETIENFIDETAHDYSHNITQILGRPELHIGTLLVAHSALWYEVDGHKLRAWLDACFFGDTRSGKSETVKRCFEHWGLGVPFTCMENFSRAGLTVGGAESGKKMRPGLWPKNNRKMLFLDEFHHMSAGAKFENVMVHLQSARDEGKVSALKVYGDLKLPAAVRLITAGNWSNRNRRFFQYFCQHLLQFYGVPESLARLDFAWAVSGPANMQREEVQHRWTTDLARALILRAWAMEPHQIHITEEAFEAAKAVCLDWDQIYASEELPLHTGVEKCHSVIRHAIAFSNMAYSHPSGKPREASVRLVHVKLAINWIVRCWNNLQYDKFSQRAIQARAVTQPFVAEALLTCVLGLEDPDHALVLLSRLCEFNSSRSLQGFIMGNGTVADLQHFSRWLGRMMRCSALEEKSENHYHIQYGPTNGGLAIIQRLLHLARDEPEEYVARFKRVEQWFKPGTMAPVPGEQAAPVGLTPLDDTDPDDIFDAPF